LYQYIITSDLAVLQPLACPRNKYQSMSACAPLILTHIIWHTRGVEHWPCQLLV